MPDSVPWSLSAADNDARTGQASRPQKSSHGACWQKGEESKFSCPRRLVPIGLMEWKGHSMAEKLTQEAIEQAPDITPEDVLDTEALLDELAQLSPIAYDQCRRDKAKLLGNVRLETLDAEVEARRAKLAEHTVTEPDAATSPEPWTEAVDGAALLTELADAVSKVCGPAPRCRRGPSALDPLHVCV